VVRSKSKRSSRVHQDLGSKVLFYGVFGEQTCREITSETLGMVRGFNPVEFTFFCPFSMRSVAQLSMTSPA
jgi:hypothetical protein